MHQILCASNNPNKIEELRAILRRIPRASVVSPDELGIRLDVEETGATFAENATLKAEAFLHEAGGIVVADDSGLVVDALDGAPGIYSARYGGSGLSDQDRNELVLAQLREVPDERRTARFVCAIAIARAGKETAVVEGTAEGRITHEPRGEHGFGYDPIFHFPPLDRTFGELDRDSKEVVSHRGAALRRALPVIESRLSGDILA